MNPQILSAIRKGELVLFLGAGASFGCKTVTGDDIPMSTDLAKTLADNAGLSYQQESLDVVYEATRQILGGRLNKILESSFRHVRPSSEYERLAKYVWRRIYTLNIDDGLDTALMRNSAQRINKRAAKDPVVERNQFFESLDYVKLNGTVDRLGDGVIFSPSEYAQATADGLPWYSQCASDFVRSPVLFIGTQLNEPLLKFHIERYQALNAESLGTSYLIARSATEIQIASLKRYKIEFIPGTLADFVGWLTANISPPPSPIDVASENIPELRALISSSRKTEFADLFEHVEAIRADSSWAKGQGRAGSIRDFYKGFKPTWEDVAESVPADLDALGRTISTIESAEASQEMLLPVLGPAGSGKTTLLMQVCWHFCHCADWSVYYIDAVPSAMLETLLAIEESATTPKVLVAIDNLEFFTEHLQFTLKSGRLKKTLVVSAERENVWNRRAKNALAGLYLQPVYVREFSEEDAKKILVKLEAYGSWTRLGKMRPQERIRELVDRSKKQLLIALLEATLGRGFEKTIEDEYQKIDSEDERLFLVAVAIATDRRCDAPVSLIDRALDKLAILRKAGAFAEDLVGIVHMRREQLSARHPVYARYLLDRVVDPAIAARAVNGLLQAFADYKSPVIQNIPKSESVLYKALINHKYLYELMKGKKDLIVPTYKNLEKRFEKDGLFWLQYGLSLRDFSDHADALEKLRIAYEAYPMPHTQHALAQQLLQVAVSGFDSTLAMGLADQAKAMLEKLEDVIDSDDTYPIVTLAEDYTQVLRVHSSDEEARGFARRYSLLLGQRAKQNPDRDRVREAYERLFKFASTGVWQD